MTTAFSYSCIVNLNGRLTEMLFFCICSLRNHDLVPDFIKQIAAKLRCFAAHSES